MPTILCKLSFSLDTWEKKVFHLSHSPVFTLVMVNTVTQHGGWLSCAILKDNASLNSAWGCEKICFRSMWYHFYSRKHLYMQVAFCLLRRSSLGARLEAKCITSMLHFLWCLQGCLWGNPVVFQRTPVLAHTGACIYLYAAWQSPVALAHVQQTFMQYFLNGHQIYMPKM